MANFSVLIAVNGAGFMNSVFLPPGGVAVQLVPFNGTNLNFVQVCALILCSGYCAHG
jgi:hypothetical protein